MGAKADVIIAANAAGANQELGKVRASVDDVARSADRASQSLGKAEGTAASGATSFSGLAKAMGQAHGAGDGFDKLLGPLGGNIGKVSGAARGLVGALSGGMGLGLVLAGVGVAVGQVAKHFSELSKEKADAAKASLEYERELREVQLRLAMVGKNAHAVKGEIEGLSRAQKIQDAQADEGYQKTLKEAANLDDKLRELKARLDSRTGGGPHVWETYQAALVKQKELNEKLLEPLARINKLHHERQKLELATQEHEEAERKRLKRKQDHAKVEGERKTELQKILALEDEIVAKTMTGAGAEAAVLDKKLESIMASKRLTDEEKARAADLIDGLKQIAVAKEQDEEQEKRRIALMKEAAEAERERSRAASEAARKRERESAEALRLLEKETAAVERAEQDKQRAREMYAMQAVGLAVSTTDRFLDALEDAVAGNEVAWYKIGVAALRGAGTMIIGHGAQQVASGISKLGTPAAPIGMKEIGMGSGLIVTGVAMGGVSAVASGLMGRAAPDVESDSLGRERSMSISAAPRRGGGSDSSTMVVEHHYHAAVIGDATEASRRVADYAERDRRDLLGA